MKTKLTLIALFAYTLIMVSCKKEKDAHIPPDMVFKTTTGYTSTDQTLAHGDSILVGVIVSKTEDDLKSFNVSYAYDGASTTTTSYNYYLQSSEFQHFEKDTWIHTRNIAGTERWIFTILDRDGNITQKSITLTVQ